MITRTAFRGDGDEDPAPTPHQDAPSLW